MSEWKKYKLGDLIDVQNGYAFKANDFSDKGIPVIKIKNIVPPRIVFDDCEYYSEKLDKRLEQFIIKKGDILISMTGSHVNQIASAVGKVGKYQFDYPALLNQRVGKLFSKNENLLIQNYFYYYISRFETQVDLASSAGGSANQANISPTQIKNLEITVPSLSTQTQIARILTSLDDKIELNLQMNQTLEAMAQAIFKEWFVEFNFPGVESEKSGKSKNPENQDADNLPKGWRMGKLGEIVEFINGYAFKSNELLDTYNNDCYHVFKMGHIKKGGGLNIEGTKSYYKKSDAQKLSKYILRKGDLLMCMTDMKGNVALLGHTALMNESDKYIVNQRVGLLRVSNDLNIDYPYLFILTNYPEFITEIRSKANSGVQVNLSTSEIKNTNIIIPPKDINEKYDNITKPIFEKIFSNIEQIRTLTQTRDTLLPKLMSGKISLNQDFQDSEISRIKSSKS